MAKDKTVVLREIFSLLNQERKSCALELAIKSDESEIAKQLVEKGYGNAKFQPIMAAIEKGNINIVKGIIEYESQDRKRIRRRNINVSYRPLIFGDDSGYTPLHKAAECGNSDIVNFLIEEGADVNAEYNNPFDGFSRTPLSDAIENNNREIVKILVEAGADIEGLNLNEASADIKKVVQKAKSKRISEGPQKLREKIFEKLNI